MVNAVLRNFIRGGKDLKLPKKGIDAASVKYSAPAELVKSLTDDYGAEQAEKFLANSLEKPVTFMRMNALLCNEEEFLAALGGIKAKKLRENCYIAEGGDVTASEAF